MLSSSSSPSPSIVLCSLHLLVVPLSLPHSFIFLPPAILQQNPNIQLSMQTQKSVIPVRITLPSPPSSSPSPSASPSPSYYYAGFRGDILNSSSVPSLSSLIPSSFSSKHFIGIPSSLCKIMGIPLSPSSPTSSPPSISIDLLSPIPSTRRVNISCVSSDDWEILSLHPLFVENFLLTQIQILPVGIPFPIFIEGRHLIQLIIKGNEGGNNHFIRVGLDSECIIEPKERKKVEQNVKFLTENIPQMPVEDVEIPPIVSLRVDSRGRWDKEQEKEKQILHNISLSPLSISHHFSMFINEETCDALKGKVGDLVVITLSSSSSHEDFQAKSQKKSSSSSSSPTSSPFISFLVRIQICSSLPSFHVEFPSSFHFLYHIEDCSLVLAQIVHIKNAFPIQKPIKNISIRHVTFQESERSKIISPSPHHSDDPFHSQIFQKKIGEKLLSLLHRLSPPLPIVNQQHTIVNLFVDGKEITIDIQVNEEKEKDKGKEGKEKSSNGKEIKDNSPSPPSSSVSVSFNSPKSLEFYLLSDPQISQSLSSQLVKPLPPLPLPLPTVVLEDFVVKTFSSSPFLTPPLPLSFVGGAEKMFCEIRNHIDSTMASALFKDSLSSSSFSSSFHPMSSGILLTGKFSKSTIIKSIAAEYSLKGIHLPLPHQNSSSPSSSLSLPCFVHIMECEEFVGHRPSSLSSHIRSLLLTSSHRSPSLIIFEDIDKLFPSPTDQHEAENLRNDELVEKFIDEMATFQHDFPHSAVCFMATSVSPLSHHHSLSLSELFGKFIEIPFPSLEDRMDIMQKSLLFKGIQMEIPQDGSDNQFHLKILSSKLDGFVASDIHQIVDRAIHAAAVRREKDKGKHNNNNNNNNHNNLSVALVSSSPSSSLSSSLSSFTLIPDDFISSLVGFLPLSLKDIPLSSSSSSLDWNSLGGLFEVKRVIKETLEFPSKYSLLFSHCPLKLRSGILLYSASGMGKSVLGMACAKECGVNLLSVKGPELLNKYIGQSESAVREIFAKARAASPCVLFFDEFESICPKRGSENTGVTDRVVNQFLCELDGVDSGTTSKSKVFILAATSRPDLIDPALLRPGRIDKIVYIDWPNEEERKDILVQMTKHFILSHDVKLEQLAKLTNGFSGADLQGLVTNAQMQVINEMMADMEMEKKEGTNNSEKVKGMILTNSHFTSSLSQTFPSLSEKDRKNFEKIYSKFLLSKEGPTDNSFDAMKKQKTALA